jgi:Ca-activated chloride channel homolog
MESFRFEHIVFLWGLAIIPLIILLYLLNSYWQKKTVRKFGNPEMVLRHIPLRSKTKKRVKLIMVLLAYAFTILAIANPQIGTEKSEAKKKGIDVMIALDVSRSMLAQDIMPNRLERSRQFISRLIGKLDKDRIGFIIFAGNAYLQMPLTIDHSAAKVFIKTVNTNTVPTQGTALADAIQLSREAFNRNQLKYKALILITDGEDHEDHEGLVEEVKQAAKEGLLIFTIGVGSAKGAPIPQYNGKYLSGYKKDKNGNIILSKLDETTLKEIALESGGGYFHFSGSNEQLNELVKKLNNLETKEIERVNVDNYTSYFQFPLLLALIFLMIDMLITFNKNRQIAKWWSFFEI